MGEALMVRAEWALAERNPDGGYRIKECGRGALRAGQFQRILDRFDPGPPPEDEPRVTLSWVGRESDPRIGMLIEQDVEVRYVCLPWAVLQGRPVSYRRLYLAFRDADLAGTVRVAGLDADRAAADLAEFGGAETAKVAALLLDGRAVAVTGAEGVGMMDRLRYLDTVAALLPYGHRSRFTGSTLVDHTEPRPIALGFGPAAPPGGVALPWRDPAVPEPASPAARDYAALAAAALAEAPAAGLVARMAAATRPYRLDDPGPALAVLRGADPDAARRPPPRPEPTTSTRARPRTPPAPWPHTPPFDTRETRRPDPRTPLSAEPPPTPFLPSPAPPPEPPHRSPGTPRDASQPPAGPPQNPGTPPSPAPPQSADAPQRAGTPPSARTSYGTGPLQGAATPHSASAPYGVGPPQGAGTPHNPETPLSAGTPYGTGTPRSAGTPHGEGTPQGVNAPHGAGASQGVRSGEAPGVEAILEGLRGRGARAAAAAVQALPGELAAQGLREATAADRALAVAGRLARAEEFRTALVRSAAEALVFQLELLEAVTGGEPDDLRFAPGEREPLEDAERLLRDFMERVRARPRRAGRIGRVGRSWARREDKEGG